MSIFIEHNDSKWIMALKLLWLLPLLVVSIPIAVLLNGIPDTVSGLASDLEEIYVRFKWKQPEEVGDGE